MFGAAPAIPMPRRYTTFPLASSIEEPDVCRAGVVVARTEFEGSIEIMLMSKSEVMQITRVFEIFLKFIEFTVFTEMLVFNFSLFLNC